MIAEIRTGLSSLKVAGDILKGLNAAHTQARLSEIQIALQQHVIEAQGALSAVQLAHSAVLDRIRNLEQQIVQFEDRETQKDQYQLETIDWHAFAYVKKAGVESGEPPHWLCAN